MGYMTEYLPPLMQYRDGWHEQVPIDDDLQEKMNNPYL